MTDLIAICSACENLVNILERRRVALGVRSDEFRARPLHRQLAAVLALGTTDGTIIQQRIRSAVHKVAAGRSLAADLAAIDARLDHLIAERDDALDELLTLS